MIQPGDIVTFKEGTRFWFGSMGHKRTVGLVRRVHHPDSIDVTILNNRRHAAPGRWYRFKTRHLQKVTPIGIDEKGRIKLKRVKDERKLWFHKIKQDCEDEIKFPEEPDRLTKAMLAAGNEYKMRKWAREYINDGDERNDP